jgi:hypothetical protein
MGTEQRKPAPAPSRPAPQAKPKPSQPNLTTRPKSLAELFKVAASLPRTEAIQYLQRNRHPSLITIGRYVLDPHIEFGVSPPPSYKPAVLPEQSLSLYQEVRRLYVFCNDPQRKSSLENDPAKRQRRFEDLLYALLADEAELLCQIVKKSLPIDHTILLDAYDELKHADEILMDRRINATTLATDAVRDAVSEYGRNIKQIEGKIAELKTRIGLHPVRLTVS